MKSYARGPRLRQIDEADFPRRSNHIAQFNFLTRYAILAPSSHNSQPWTFATKNYKLLLLADSSRWLPVADADRRELHISLGCALENLLIAAAHFGYACKVEYFPEPDDDQVVARVELVPATGGSLHHPELFDAITMRHTNRRPYESIPLLPEHVRQLRACCEGEDISFELRGDGIVRAGIDHLVQRADAIQFANPEYRKELARWIGQGAFGTPWPAAKINEVVVSHFNVGGAVARKDASAVRSAPFVGLLSSVRNDRLSQVRGRAGVRTDGAHRFAVVNSASADESGPGDPGAPPRRRQYVRRLLWLPSTLVPCRLRCDRQAPNTPPSAGGSMGLKTRPWVTVAAILLAVLAASVSARISLALAKSPQSMLLTVDLPDRPAAGATLFEEKSCARCHAIGGTGAARIGPDLGRVVFFGDVLDLAGAFWNHAPVMKQKMAELRIPRPTITSDDAANLVAFLTAFRYYETQIREAGNPALGSMVFVKKGCAACHEPGPERRAQGPDLRKYRGRYAPIVFTQAMWNHSPAMTKAMADKGMPPPAFTGREMTDLAAYLQVGLAPGAPDPVVFEPGSPRRGQDLFASKGCNTCHAVAGKGGQGGPDLGTKGRAMARSVPEIAGLMWNHSQQMNAEFARRGVARPSFAGQEMGDLVAYLYFVNYANVRGTPFRGGQVFSRKCASCHTLGRQSVGPDLLTAAGLDQPIGIIASMWNHATAMEQQSSRRGRSLPRLERGETADLTAFLISRRAAARGPGRGPNPEARPRPEPRGPRP